MRVLMEKLDPVKEICYGVLEMRVLMEKLDPVRKF
jgi:hypothetical protein